MMRQREDYTHPCRERTHRARPLASAFAVPAASFLRGCRRQKESKGAFSFCHHQQRMFFYFIFSLCAWGRAGPSFLTAEREQDHIFSPPVARELFIFIFCLVLIFFLYALRPRGPSLSAARKGRKTAEGGRPLREPPWAYLFFGQGWFLSQPRNKLREKRRGGYSHRLARLFRRAALLLARRW